MHFYLSGQWLDSCVENMRLAHKRYLINDNRIGICYRYVLITYLYL